MGQGDEPSQPALPPGMKAEEVRGPVQGGLGPLGAAQVSPANGAEEELAKDPSSEKGKRKAQA